MASQEQFTNYYLKNEESKVASAQQVKSKQTILPSNHFHSVSAAGQSSHASSQAKNSLRTKSKVAEDSDDSDFEEAPDQRAILQVLANLPGITATDSMGYRIEEIRGQHHSMFVEPEYVRGAEYRDFHEGSR